MQTNKKEITVEQINAILQVVYQTNISAANFDAIKKLVSELPEVKEEKKDDKPEVKN